MLKANLQKTILGNHILKFQFYKMETFKDGKNKQITKGFIWFSNGMSIRIEGSKFLIILKDRKTFGYLGSSMKAYKQIKRMLANWFRPYKKHRVFKYGDGYLTRRHPVKEFLLTAKV